MAKEVPGAASSAGTFTERARRAQLIAVTTELVADEGYQGASLSRIAERAELSKAAVLYHVGSKDALIQAAYAHTLTALTSDVARAVQAAAPAEAPAAYIRAMIGHLGEHPRHTRMLIEALSHGVEEHASAERWQPLAEILEAAGVAGAGESRTVALVIGGGIDAIVREGLEDPDYDTAAAAEQLAALTAGSGWVRR